MKLIITGDFVINQPYTTDNISQEVINLFQSSDFNIVNLEAPVTNSQSKIVKTGPHLKANKVSTLSVLKALDINLVTLANNHVLDYDEQGVHDTLSFCKENSFATVGAGENKEEASKAFYIDSPEGKIAILNLSENEWASATETTAGANGMDLIDDAKKIQEAKTKSNFVIVIVHGGHEYYNLPSPRMQKQYRYYIDNGADLVIGHHTHCISGNEEYKGKQIYYSLGNFLFTKQSVYEDWYLGLLVELTIQDGKISSELRPVKQDKVNYGLSLVESKEKEAVFNQISAYSATIGDVSELSQKWKNYIESKHNTYANYWFPIPFIKNRYIKAGLTKLGINGRDKKSAALILNLLRCEAHTDMSKEVVKNILK